MPAIATPSITPGASVPFASARRAVRGLRASMSRSGVAVGGHRGGSRAEYGEGDPDELVGRGQTARGEQRARVGERQSEQRVRDANLAQHDLHDADR